MKKKFYLILTRTMKFMFSGDFMIYCLFLLFAAGVWFVHAKEKQGESLLPRESEHMGATIDSPIEQFIRE